MSDAATETFDAAEPVNRSWRKPTILLFSLALLAMAAAADKPALASGSCTGDLMALAGKPLLPTSA